MNTTAKGRTNTVLCRSLLTVALSAAISGIQAADNVWQGGTGDWNDPNNWSGLVPAATDDVKIDDGDVGTASDVNLNITTTITTLTIDAGDSLTHLNGKDMTLNGGATNNGTWMMDGSTSDTFLQFLANATLGGSGELILDNDPQNRLLTNNATLTHGAAHTIRGGGQLLINTGGMINEGTILAEGEMSIDPNALGFTNNGTLQATTGSTLNLLSGTFTNNTSIDAADGAIVEVRGGAVIVGGTLNAAGTGVFELKSTAQLEGVTVNGAMNQSNGNDVNIVNGITNNGTWTMNGTSSDSFTQFLGTQTLDGNGELILNDDPQNRLLTNNATLTHGAAHTIRGGGQLLINTGGMINEGTILAEGEMSIDPNALGFTNNGTLQATTGSTLNLLSGTFTNNTSIDAADGAIVEVRGGAVIVGGTLNAAGPGVFELKSTAQLEGVTVNGAMNQSNGNDVNIVNGITNNGTWTMNGTSSDSFAQFLGDQTLDGNGELILNDDPQNRLLTNNTTLTHGAAHTIRGGGQLLINTGGMINEGTILAEGEMSIDPNALGFTNNGTLQATTGSTLNLLSGTFTNNTSIDAADGAIVEVRGGAVIVGGTLNAAGTGVFELKSTAQLEGVTVNGAMNQSNGNDVNIVNGITNNGSWTMNGTSNDSFAQFLGDQTISGSGELVLNNDPQNRVLTNNTTLTNGADHTIRGGGLLLHNTGGLINDGTIIADSVVVTSIDANALGFLNSGTGKLQATGTAGIDILTGGFSNAGSVEIAAVSRIDRTGDYTQTGGSTTVNGILTTTAPSLIDLQGGVLEGAGVIESDVLNSGGNVNAGSAADLTDTLTIDGDYQQGNLAIFSLEIGGLDQGIEYDLLSIINGDATLDGGLSVSLAGGFMPGLADTFDILTADNVIGTFDVNQLLFPIFGGKTFEVTYLSDTVRLTTIDAGVVPVPAAVWLFGSALAGLFAAGRRRTTR